MALSIKTKIILPVVISALMMAALILAAWYILEATDKINHELSHRFHEIEEVREIEVAISTLIHPHLAYISFYDEKEKNSVQKIFNKIGHILDELDEMEVINEAERKFIVTLTQKIEQIKTLSNQVLNTTPDQHKTAMKILDQISNEHILEVREMLIHWHEQEARQVNELSEKSEHELRKFSGWMILFIMASVALFIFSLWINNTVLIRPIVSLSRSTNIVASGNLKQKMTIFADDELGDLARDINHMAESLDEMYTKMEKLAKTDQLTGLLNRHAYEETIVREMSICKRHHENLALAILDIDLFKKINDTYGHLVGDDALKFVSDICIAIFRDCDYCFRYGGEEFVILMPKTNMESALIAAERIRIAIAENEFVISNTATINITVSIGLANYQGDDRTEKQVFSQADKALYLAKEAGRNQVISYKENS